MERREITWKVASGGAGLLAGLGARALVGRVRRATGPDEEGSPTDPRIPWATAIGWTVATAVAVGVARVLAVRGAARAWEVATDEAPPGTAAPA